MKNRFYLTALVTAWMTLARAGEEPTPTPTPLPSEEPNMRAALHAQLEEDAKKASAARPRPSPLYSAKSPAAANPVSGKSNLPPPSPSPAPTALDAAAAARAKEEGVTLMPKVEVRKDRITELDRQVHAKDKEIEQETKKTEASETDKALNPAKASGFLSIFGGRSAEVGEGLAKQRVMLLEVERDLVAEIALAKTKEEKADLQKQLDEIKAMRRDLEKTR